jgi:hypothetical protein
MELLEEVIKGLQIILEVNESTELQTDHDIIWCGDYAETPKDKREQLVELGWELDKNIGRWVKYI